MSLLHKIIIPEFLFKLTCIDEHKSSTFRLMSGNKSNDNIT